MSKLVTFEQAKKLKELNFPYTSPICIGKYKDPNSYVNDIMKHHISEALEWFREVKGIPCNVSLDVFEDEYRPFIYQYTGMYWEGYSVFDTDSFDTHSIAESALLDALIEYEVKRIEFNNNRTEIDE